MEQEIALVVRAEALAGPLTDTSVGVSWGDRPASFSLLLSRSLAVPIRPFLDRDDAFGPEDIAPVSAAFEAALGKLGLADVVGRNKVL